MGALFPSPTGSQMPDRAGGWVGALLPLITGGNHLSAALPPSAVLSPPARLPVEQALHGGGHHQ